MALASMILQILGTSCVLCAVLLQIDQAADRGGLRRWQRLAQRLVGQPATCSRTTANALLFFITGGIAIGFALFEPIGGVQAVVLYTLQCIILLFVVSMLLLATGAPAVARFLALFEKESTTVRKWAWSFGLVGTLLILAGLIVGL